MWTRFSKRIAPTLRRTFASASISTCIAAAVITPSTFEDKTQRMTKNRILSDKHRIALGSWPIHKNEGGVDPDDNRVSTLDNLIQYLKEAGYDGVECHFKHFVDMYFKQSSLSKTEIATLIKNKFAESGLKVFGFLSHSQNKYWGKDNVDKYLSNLRESIHLNKIMGAEYVTFQIDLTDKYMYGDGSYRNDDTLLLEFVDRIKTLQNVCFEEGMNFYVETHVWRISEDPEAFAKIIDLFDVNDEEFEVNGDLSHFICRGMLKGPFIDKILNKMEHTHVRMARVYGDISVDVTDPIKDWNDEDGVTQTYWRFTKNGFKNGLSSRVIVGESGPYQLVTDALAQDKKMVPLLRAMAEYCDNQAQQNDFRTENFNPFQTVD